MLVTSEMAKLYPSHPITFSVGYREWQYFNIDIKNQSESYIISFTRSSGEVMFFVNVFEDHFKNKRPTEDDWDFIVHYDQITITPQQLYHELRKYTTAPTSYNVSFVVGALGTSREDSQYQINCYTSSHPVLNILQGTSQDVTLQKNEYIFFEFYNFIKEDIKFIFSREVGLGVMQISACRAGRPMESCMKEFDIEKRMTGVSSAVVQIDKSKRLKEKTKNIYIYIYKTLYMILTFF